MATTYEMDEYNLVFIDEFQTLQVIRVSDDAEMDSIDLTEVRVKVWVEGTQYFLNEGEDCESCYEAKADTEAEEEMQFSGNRFIGVTDLRADFKGPYNYYLDECPVYLKIVNGEFKIKSPCVSPCAAPKTGCREASE